MKDSEPAAYDKAFAPAFVLMGFLLGVLFTIATNEIIVSQAESDAAKFRAHMIHNNLAEWVINQDGKNVLVLKGRQVPT
jgi:hypothetical protein